MTTQSEHGLNLSMGNVSSTLDLKSSLQAQCDQLKEIHLTGLTSRIHEVFILGQWFSTEWWIGPLREHLKIPGDISGCRSWAGFYQLSAPYITHGHKYSGFKKILKFVFIVMEIGSLKWALQAKISMLCYFWKLLEINCFLAFCNFWRQFTFLGWYVCPHP